MSEELELLIESVTTAWRERGADGRPIPPPAWWDLSAEERELAFDAQTATRDLERAMDSSGFSGTVRAVLERVSRAP